MKRAFSFREARAAGLVVAGAGLVAATYGLVRLAYGLFLPDLERALSFDAGMAGLISSGSSVAYCLGAGVGFFGASRHPRLLVAAAGLSGSLGAAGMAASHHTEVFATFAVVGSVGAGLASPGLVSIVSRNARAGVDDRSQAIVNAGTGPGLAAAGILALVLLPDWRLAWCLVAAGTLAIAGVVLVLDGGGRQVRATEFGSVLPAVPPSSWFTTHLPIIVPAFLMGAGSAAVWNYGRTLLVDAGASELTSVAAWVALGIGGTAVIGTARPMSTLDARTAWTITTLTIAAASSTLALVPGTTTVALAACAAFGWGFTAGSGALIAWTTQIDAARAPAGTSLLFVVLVLGQAFGATAVGALVSAAGLATAFLVAAAVTLTATATPWWWSGRAARDRQTV